MKKFMLIGLMLAATSAFAGLNKWVDAEGKVHYSDQPPPVNVKAKVLRTDAVTPVIPTAASSAVATSAPAAPKTIAEREADLKKAQQSKKEAEEKAAREQARLDNERANCASAQQNLRTLQDGMRIVEVEPSGERSYLSDEQRRQRFEKAQQEIRKYCK